MSIRTIVRFMKDMLGRPCPRHLARAFYHCLLLMDGRTDEDAEFHSAGGGADLTEESLLDYLDKIASRRYDRGALWNDVIQFFRERCNFEDGRAVELFFYTGPGSLANTGDLVLAALWNELAKALEWKLNVSTEGGD